MATKQQLTQDFLTCIVCHEVFIDPVTLHCGHTLCAECVTGFLKTQIQAVANGSIPCPSCRGLTKVPDAEKPVEEWVGQIKTGFFVKSLVETLAAAPEVEEQLCSSCLEDGKQQPASTYCVDCKEDYCRECEQWHKKMLKKHKTQRSSAAAARKSKPNIRVCAEHAQCPLDMMCEDCDKVLCQKCCIVYHRRCESVITLEQAVAKIDVVLENQLQTLEKEISKLKTGVNLTKTKVEMLEESADKAEKDVDAACDKMVSLVAARQTQLKEKIGIIKESAVRDLKADVKNEEMKLEDAQQKQGLIHQVLKSEVPMDHYEMYRICSPGDVEYQSTDRQAERVTQIDFSQEKMKNVLKNLEESGIGDVETFSDEFSDSEKSNDDTIDELSSHEEDVTKRRYELMRSIDTGLNSLCGIVVLTAGNTKVVVYAGCRYVKAFYDEKGKPQHSCLYFESRSISLSKVSDSEATVQIDGSTLVIMKVKPQLEIVTVVKVLRSYGKIAASTCMRFVAFYSCGECFYRCYHSGIDTFDLSGRIVQSISVEERSASSLVVISNDRIIISDGSFLSCVDYQGKLQLNLKKEQYAYSKLCLWEESSTDVCVLKTRYERSNSESRKTVYQKVSLLLKLDTEVDLIDESQLQDFQKDPFSLIATDSDGLVYLSNTSRQDKKTIPIHVFGFK